MNPFGIFVLATLLLSFALDVIARALDLRSQRQPPPPELAHLYPPDRYRAAQDYARARALMSVTLRAVSLPLLLAFWGLGGFGWLDGLVRGLGLGPVPSGLLFLGALGAAQAVLLLPFDVYSTFGIEQRFGFNRTTVRTFVLDRVKLVALGLAIGGPLLAAVLALFEWLGPQAWWLCWALSAAVSVGLQTVYPAWILPLFLRFERLPEGELRGTLADYANRVGFAFADIFVVDGSRRSSRANAFFAGLGSRRRIALFDTLVSKLEVSELRAVLAHEVAHSRLRHIPIGTALGLLEGGLLLFLLSRCLTWSGPTEALGFAQPSVYAGFVAFGLLATPLEGLLSVVGLWLSRRFEYQADRWAAETTGEPEAMAGALEKLALDHLAPLTPHPLRVALEYSHPPLRDRLRPLRASQPGGTGAAVGGAG
ncbi:MAG TPA: M48 family metallopeptidase [Thermoanaerobaculia bacterium]|nr:M48 family metallopeptidase [Thermoanaerobaculia bacterium]